MNTKNVILFLSLFLFSISCDETVEPEDCAGVAGGSAIADECAVCDTDSTNDNLTCADCNGVANGGAVNDQCDVCDGDNSTCTDCAGVINGDSVEDLCGTCDNNPDNDCTNDCAGTPGGSATLDCSGVCNGTATIDECGTCVSDATSEDYSCIIDCSDTWGGSAYLNECGDCIGLICSDDTATCENDAEIDSACGEGGTCVLDQTCTSDSSGNYCYANERDCTGFCCGDSLGIDCAIEDDCGTCISDSTPTDYECLQDCFGDWGGDAAEDCSGECRGGNTGLTPYELCGCFEEAADNFFCDADEVEDCNGNGDYCADECVIGSGSTTQFINPYTETGENNLLLGLVYNTGCEVWGCTDVTASNYNASATNCEDGTDFCCDYFFISFNTVGNGVYDDGETFVDADNNEIWDEGESFTDLSEDLTDNELEIYITNSSPIGGFQFDIENASFSGIVDGNDELAFQSGFMTSVSGNRVIGFSLTGATIPESNNALLLKLTVTGHTLPLCLTDIIVSDKIGAALNFVAGDCLSE